MRSVDTNTTLEGMRCSLVGPYTGTTPAVHPWKAAVLMELVRAEGLRAERTSGQGDDGSDTFLHKSAHRMGQSGCSLLRGPAFRQTTAVVHVTTAHASDHFPLLGRARVPGGLKDAWEGDGDAALPKKPLCWTPSSSVDYKAGILNHFWTPCPSECYLFVASLSFLAPLLPLPPLPPSTIHHRDSFQDSLCRELRSRWISECKGFIALSFLLLLLLLLLLLGI
ncbi:unnamed protein product [Prorocentrum cordatum]|uniref:Uncharacterized protein n=1 Tax=Prorocentrum cordatum TaxID=2364126 RepID=A0ABN9UNG4_9DINO|nr:unnamed protein product [Polarella glacialis]